MSKKYPQLDDKEWLEKRYFLEFLSLPQIANIIECTHGAVWQAFIRLGIKRRTISEAKKGKNYLNHTLSFLSESTNLCIASIEQIGGLSPF